MAYASMDIRERDAFVKTSLDETLSMLADSEVEDRLAHYHAPLKAMAETAVVATIVDDQFVPPTEFDPTSDVMTIVALRPGETVSIGSDYQVQTKSQAATMVRTLSGWNPRTANTLQECIEVISSTPFMGIAEPLHVSLQDNQLGAVYSPGQPYLSSLLRKEDFYASPSRGYVVFHERPYMFLTMSPGIQGHRADVMAHEFTHGMQFLQNPVHVHETQTDADLLRLFIEFEAYHVGAIIGTHYIHGEAGFDAKSLPDQYSNSQLKVNELRMSMPSSPHNPYWPTKNMLRKILKDPELVTIISPRTPFAATMKALQEDAAEEGVA